MSKLICADLSLGRSLRVSGVRYVIHKFKKGKTQVELTRDDGKAVDKISISRSELYARLTDESACLEDETEDPDFAAQFREVNLTYLSTPRVMDWWQRMIILRHLLPYATMSPRSVLFQRECEAARRMLSWVRANTIDMSDKEWSDRTLNNILRRWRKAGGAFEAFQSKGLRHAPWRTTRDKYARARALIDAVRREYPNISGSAVRRIVNYRLNSSSASEYTPESN